MRAQYYRSVEDDVEQRRVSTLGENDDDDERDDDAAGKGFGSSPFSRVSAFALGAVALLGFGTIASSRSSNSYNSARGSVSFRLGSRHHSSSSSSSS